jgi:hypothetical protein
MKHFSKDLKIALWEIAEGDRTEFRLLLLDLLLDYFNIDEDKDEDVKSLLLKKKVNITLFEEDSTLDEVVSRIQQLFTTAPNGARGNRAQIKDRLFWYLSETNETLERIELAVKLYIDECITNNRFAQLPHFFIYKHEAPNETKTLQNSNLHEFVCRLDDENIPTEVDIYG